MRLDMLRKPKPDVVVPTHRAALCPTCVARVKVSTALEKGKRVLCPQRKNPFDPFSASSIGSNLGARQSSPVAGDDPGLPEWQWAVLIGVGCGLLLGSMIGFMFGQIFSSAPGAAETGMLGSVPFWIFAGSVGYALYGTAIALAMVLTGGSKAGYIVAFVGVLPVMIVLTIALGINGTIIGAAATFGFATGIERIIDYKLYS